MLTAGTEVKKETYEYVAEILADGHLSVPEKLKEKLRETTFLSQLHRQEKLFDAKYPLTGKIRAPKLQPIEKNVLPKQVEIS